MDTAVAVQELLCVTEAFENSANVKPKALALLTEYALLFMREATERARKEARRAGDDEITSEHLAAVAVGLMLDF